MNTQPILITPRATTREAVSETHLHLAVPPEKQEPKIRDVDRLLQAKGVI